MSGRTERRLVVALTFDHDALSSPVDRGEGPVLRSRGEFGPRVGVPRVLDLLRRHSIPATFFVPGHTAVTFPDSVRAIVDGGHEIACHGWAHEDLAALPVDGQRALLEHSRDTLAEAYVRAPVGFRAPYWSLGEETLQLVEEAGFTYDSSLMDDDVRLHRVRFGARHSRERSELGHDGDLVEVPVSWTLDDWPQFEPGRLGLGPMSAPSKVEEIWAAELRWAWEHEPGGVLTFTMHPEAIGRMSRIAMLERLIETAESLEGIVFDRLDTIVDHWAVANPRAARDASAPARD
ncbi:MAG TPA: polysaccharide deacetylase [Candidatus Limnocylindrales bacterium]|nr:polysaccharide deacetylase [Candidatus Limnocylindrales bacterium]